MTQNTFNRKRASYCGFSKFVVLSILSLSCYSGFAQCNEYALTKLKSKYELITSKVCSVQQGENCICHFNYKWDRQIPSTHNICIYAFPCDKENEVSFSVYKNDKFNSKSENKNPAYVPAGTAFQMVSAGADDSTFTVEAKFSNKPMKSKNDINIIVVDASREKQK